MPQALYDRAACGLLTADATGTILEVNDTLAGWLGIGRTDLIGRPFVDLLTGGGRIYHETHYSPMLTMQGSAREIAFDLVCIDGTRVPVLVNARVDRDDDGAITHVAIFDATERRLYERELLAAKERAERSEEQVRVLGRAVQETLLPHGVPSVPGLDIAAVYLPAGAGHEIGGDFYDVFQVAVDDWVIVIGDVEGKGVRAAVVTAMVRYTIRAASIEHEPDGVLRIVNEVLRRDDSPHYCTALIMRFRRSSDTGWLVTVSAGGHPLPIRADATRAEAIGRHGMLLGLFDDVNVHNIEARLGVDDTVIAYTDGITEPRRDGTMLGDLAIADLAVRYADRPVAGVLEHIVAAALEFGGDPNRDDIAAIAVRTSLS